MRGFRRIRRGGGISIVFASSGFFLVFHAPSTAGDRGDGAALYHPTQSRVYCGQLERRFDLLSFELRYPVAAAATAAAAATSVVATLTRAVSTAAADITPAVGTASILNPAIAGPKIRRDLRRAAC